MRPGGIGKVKMNKRELLETIGLWLACLALSTIVAATIIFW